MKNNNVRIKPKFFLCTKCGIEKQFDEFYKHKDCKFGIDL